MMKTIALVALLAAAGCSKKGSDCEASIGKGMESFMAKIKANSGNSPMFSPARQERMQHTLGTLKTTLVQRCTEDKWPSEVMSCFTTVTSRDDMKACQTKLSSEQQTKVNQAIVQAMMGGRGGMMPAGVAGHPPILSGSGAPAGMGDAPAGSEAAPPAGTTAPAGSAAAPPAGSATAPAGSTAAPPAGSTAKPAGATTPAAGSAAAPASGW